MTDMEMSGVQAVEGMMSAIPGDHRACDRMAWVLLIRHGYEEIEPGDWVFTDRLGRHPHKPAGVRRREAIA